MTVIFKLINVNSFSIDFEHLFHRTLFTRSIYIERSNKDQWFGHYIL